MKARGGILLTHADDAVIWPDSRYSGQLIILAD